MLTLHGLEHFRAPWNSASLTLGVFDGIHRGHRTLLEKLKQESPKNVDAKILVTYHPHPDLVLRKKSGAVEIFTYEEKLSLLQNYNLTAALFLPFTRELADMRAIRFLEEILIRKLRASHIIIGYDQCFGRNREGDYNFLKENQEKLSYHLEKIEPVQSDGVIISSSTIRDLLQNGNIKKCNYFLGHTYFITGLVVDGLKRGGKIGFPTANIDVPETKLIPACGVYVGFTKIDSVFYPTMINIGESPTFKINRLRIEAHLIGYSGNLYDQNLRIYFYDKIREEKKFDSIEELKAQLNKDKQTCEELFQKIDIHIL